MPNKFNRAKTGQLFKAIESNNAKKVSALIEAGADPNAQDKSMRLGFDGPTGATPLT